MEARILLNKWGHPYYQLTCTPDEIEDTGPYTLRDGPAFYTATLTDSALSTARIIAGPGTEGHTCGCKPEVLVDGRSYALDYNQWLSIRWE